MGALTLKSFPFEIRGWDIEKFESFDPTDGFGSNVRVYIHKNQIILIEPDFSLYNFNTWITDKGRQFFDAIFKTWPLNDQVLSTNNFWTNFFSKIIKTIYIFELCNKQKNKNYSCTIVCGNLSNEISSLLLILSQNYSFIKLRKSESSKITADLESNFQLNDIVNKIKFSSSTLCLLIATNPRYEGYYLNLNLRQRFLKGNFKCLAIGSLIDITFPISFLGSNAQIIKSIAEGNNFVCQNLKSSKNPFLIYNNELSKRNDSRYIFESLKTLSYLNVFNKTWNGLNTLNPSLTDTGQFVLQNMTNLKLKDLNNFSSLYFLNVTINNISNLKKITELKILKQNRIKSTQLLNIRLILDQKTRWNNNVEFLNKITKNYFYVPNSTFYENEETFINTEGFVKRTTKLILNRKNKSSWQILRKLLANIKTKLTFLAQKKNNILFFNLQKWNNFKNFINFQYYSTQSLINLGFHLNKQNKKIILNNTIQNFKSKNMKFNHTKLKYWLDNFFTGGKDEYSKNSITLNNCFKVLRSESTNFF